MKIHHHAYLALSILLVPSYLHAQAKTFITGHAFKQLADYVIEKNSCLFDPQTIPAKSIIFVRTENLPFFFEHVFTQLKNPIILITHNSDLSAPGSFSSYLDNPKIVRWFGQNKDIDYHPKFTGIPIGIANTEWPNGKQEIFNTVLEALEKATLKKTEQIYLNFSPSTNRQRRILLNLLRNKSFAFIARTKPLNDYLQEMAHFTYVLSPFGLGLDCHRTWEALLLGCIPVVATSTLDSLYKDLPVIILDKWQDISLELLQEKYLALTKQVFNREQIFMEYWVQTITTLKNNYEPSV